MTSLHFDVMMTFCVNKFPPMNKNSDHKKVLLRERKRYTAHRVASARYAGGWGGGGTPSSHGGGYAIQSWWGGMPSSHDGGEGTPSSHGGGRGTPSSHGVRGGTPSLVWVGGYPMQSWWGRGIPLPPRPEMGYPPPPQCGQTENITFPHPSDAGGNKSAKMNADFLSSAKTFL